jgi:hypothetical protein
MAAAKPFTRRKRTGKIGFHGFLCRQFRLHHQGFNAKRLERLGCAPSHPETQDRLAVLKGFSHVCMIMPVRLAIRTGTLALAMLRRTRTIRPDLFPRYPSVFNFKHHERRTSPKMGSDKYPVVGWYCNLPHDSFFLSR